MKRIIKITSIIGILLALLITTVSATGLTVDVNEDALDALTTSLVKPIDNEEINTDVFLMEDNALIKNNVNGNVYVVGETINISSENIDGDVFVIGEEVTINSNITGNIYVIANNFYISGSLKDAFVIAENLNIKENTSSRDFKIIGTNIKLDGIVNRDVYAVSGDINIADTGKIDGILSYAGEIDGNTENVKELKIIEDVFIEFEKTDEQIEYFFETVAKSISLFFFFTAEMAGFIIIAILVLFTSKKQINNSELKEYGLMDTVYGLLYFGATILIIIALVFTLIGIPVSILLGLILWFIFWKITIPVASIQLTKAILKQENKSKVFVWFISFIIFTLVQCTVFIPTFGGLIKAIISLYGFGYMIRSVLRKNKAEETNVEII